MQQVDTLIHARWIIPVDAQHSVLEHHSLAISEDRIIAILPTSEATQTYSGETELELGEHALLPGLINSHTHAAMTLFRGIADDLALMDWLENHIWPAEQKYMNESFVQLGVELAIAEMISGGVTCMNDMYFYPDVTARTCQQAGFRASVGLIVLDFPTVWANDADAYIDKGLDVHDQYRDSKLISTAFAPHAPYTVSDPPLEKVRTLADELDIPVHIHVHETAVEVQQSIDNFGLRPLQRLHQLGLVSPALQAVHMTQMADEDFALLADNGSHVIHCPESNLKLASGFCPLARLSQQGINVALGTDGTASNNDLDMFGEMRTAALLAKGMAADATAAPAWQVLEMATRNAARALMLEDSIGSLETGKQADIIAVDFDTLSTTPVFDPVSHLVYCCNRNNVTDVWIAGKAVMKNRQLNTLDSTGIKQQATALAATFN
jgi:5-methylthioadenosine/S-adenosylhomocysteine deaminase